MGEACEACALIHQPEVLGTACSARRAWDCETLGRVVGANDETTRQGLVAVVAVVVVGGG